MSDVEDRVRRALSSAPRRETAVQRLAPVWSAVREARTAGVTWADISAKLAESGLVRADGAPYPASTLVQVGQRLEGKAPRSLPKSLPARTDQAARLAAPSPPPEPGPTAEDAALFEEIDAMLALPSGQTPTQTLDDYLKERKNYGKSKA